MTPHDELQLASDLGLTTHFVIGAKIAAAYSSIDWSNPYQSPGEKHRALVKELTAKLEALKAHCAHFRAALIDRPHHAWYLEPEILKCCDEIDQLSKRLYYLKLSAKKNKTPREEFILKKKSNFDIAQIKQIPIPSLTEILPSSFFVHNPFRPERSPSDSLHYIKATNTWYDFVTNRHGDCIDLFMKLYNCSFQDACKELSKMI